jgi:hypothetical protein
MQAIKLGWPFLSISGTREEHLRCVPSAEFKNVLTLRSRRCALGFLNVLNKHFLACSGAAAVLEALVAVEYPAYHLG